MDLFGTAGIRGPVETEVTPRLALEVGQAIGAPDREFVLGRDGRVTGETISAAMRAGLESAGSTVRKVSVVPTPTLAFASQDRYGVQVTASHNPAFDSGIKLFDDGVELDSEAERVVSKAVSEGPTPTSWERWGQTESIEVREDYREAVEAYIRTVAPGANEPERPLAGMTIAVDCGNGMGSLGTPQVLARLGAEVVTINGTVDGYFPGRPSKPTPETLSEFRAFLANHPAELGIAHDGDADRIVLVDGDGDVVHEDTVVAVLAGYYVERSDAPEPVVVTTPNASGRIDERVEKAGGRVERVRLGALHEGIARIENGPVVFAAEPWKHIHPPFGGWIDGIASAGVISLLAADAGGIDALREPVTERPYRKVSISCPEEKKAPTLEMLIEDLPEVYPEAGVDTEYGLRLTFDGGAWALIRPSGTEPYVRLYAESEDVERLVDELSEEIERAIDA